MVVLTGFKRMTTTARTSQSINDFLAVTIFPGMNKSEMNNRTTNILLAYNARP